MGWQGHQSGVKCVISLAAFCTVCVLLFQHQKHKKSRHAERATDIPARYCSVWLSKHNYNQAYFTVFAQTGPISNKNKP